MISFRAEDGWDRQDKEDFKAHLLNKDTNSLHGITEQFGLEGNTEDHLVGATGRGTFPYPSWLQALALNTSRDCSVTFPELPLPVPHPLHSAEFPIIPNLYPLF